jgi:hypothetical protein
MAEPFNYSSTTQPSAPTHFALSSDGRVVTLTPLNRLTESAVYKVFVNQVEDKAGLRIASAFTSTFTTADETAPAVSAINPANGATEVAPGANVVITFNEPIDNTANLATYSSSRSFNRPIRRWLAVTRCRRIIAS